MLSDAPGPVKHVFETLLREVILIHLVKETIIRIRGIVLVLRHETDNPIFTRIVPNPYSTKTNQLTRGLIKSTPIIVVIPAAVFQIIIEHPLVHLAVGHMVILKSGLDNRIGLPPDRLLVYQPILKTSESMTQFLSLIGRMFLHPAKRILHNIPKVGLFLTIIVVSIAHHPAAPAEQLPALGITQLGLGIRSEVVPPGVTI